MITKLFKWKRLLQINSWPISVYEGISPSLLATVSLSEGVKGTNNEELIASLVKSNIIRNKKLQSVMKRIDRRQFISQIPKNSTYYQNKPYKISGGQTMSDIFTHAVILEEVTRKIQQLVKIDTNKEICVLDVGTGHGYLAFIIAHFISQLIADVQRKISYRVIGIDCNNKSIQECNKLKNKIILNNNNNINSNLQFYTQNLQTRLLMKQYYDIIIGGFYMPPTLHECLLAKIKESNNNLNRNTFGIWSSDSNSGQSLFWDKSNIHKCQIMSTMFSMPVCKSNVQHYFIEEGRKGDNQQQQIKQNTLNEKQQINGLKVKKKMQQKQKLRIKLKVVINKYNSGLNKKLSLSQMKLIPQINSILEQLNRK